MLCEYVLSMLWSVLFSRGLSERSVLGMWSLLSGQSGRSVLSVWFAV
jgi:hypothetical protein